MSPPRDAVRHLVISRRRAAHDAVTAMLASLTPERTAGDWLDLGSAVERATGRIERRVAFTRNTVR